MNWRTVLVAFLLVGLAAAQAQQSPSANDWKAFDFLMGEWTWVGGGQAGQGKGTSTFRPELGGTVLVRKTHLDYVANKERAAYAHDDILYVYHDPADNSLRAIFFDGIGHVIRYSVAVAPGENSIQFLSDAAPGGTRCRMTHTKTGPDSMTEKFEIAPPGKPDEFKTYVEFAANRIGR